jgi:hypothetical protein
MRQAAGVCRREQDREDRDEGGGPSQGRGLRQGLLLGRARAEPGHRADRPAERYAKGQPAQHHEDGGRNGQPRRHVVTD